MASIYYNFILILSLTSFYGAAVYYFYRLNYIGVILTLILVAITFIILKKSGKVKNEFRIKNLELRIKKNDILLVTCYLLLVTVNFFILFNSQITQAITSPWEAVPWQFFFNLAITTLLLFIIILKTKLYTSFYLLLITIYLLLAASIAVIVYKIGFGFDPFIHQATEKLIVQTGLVNPKPLYYLGQYSLVVILHKIFFIPIALLDKLLVPVLTAILLPFAFFKALCKFTAETRQCLVSTMLMLILPFSIFTITTPQNLAYLFLILLVLLSLTTYDLRLTTVLAFATFAVHPIAGIPAILFVIILNIKDFISSKKILYTLYFILYTLATIALPLAFLITNNSLSNSTNSTNASFNLPKIFFSDTGSSWLNFSYLYGFNTTLIIFILIISGILITRKRIFNIKYSILNIYLLMSCALIVSFIITKFLNFSYLINYEQSNFADRILILAVIFSLPFIMAAIAFLVNKILQQNIIIKYSFVCFFVLLISASLYHSYPRLDDYHNSKNFSTSQADINAVRWIDQDAGKNDYIVLANQQVSAAALNEYGFKKYYETENGKLFYYPIPTGEKLYRYYLDMVYKNANKQTALEAGKLVGADTVYFVLNNYWFGFEKILAEARIDAANVKKIDNGEVFIFKYSK